MLYTAQISEMEKVMKNKIFFVIFVILIISIASGLILLVQNWPILVGSQVEEEQPLPEEPGETPEEPGETPDDPEPEEPEQTNKVLKLVWDEIEFVDEGFPFDGDDVWTDGANLYYLDDYRLNKDTLVRMPLTVEPFQWYSS